jgi:hypothetical protein
MVTGYYNLYVGQIVPNHFFKLPLQLIRQNIVVALWVIGFAIIPNKLNMIQHLFDSPILSCFQLILYLQQIHGVLDDQRIVIEFKF